MAHCENCGSRIGVHGCNWCNEELYILDQHYEQEMELPDEETVFMQKTKEQQSRINQGIDKTIHNFKTKQL